MKQKYLKVTSKLSLQAAYYLRGLLYWFCRVFQIELMKSYRMEECSNWRVKLCVYNDGKSGRKMHLYSDDGDIHLKNLDQLDIVELEEGLYFLHVVKEEQIENSL